MYDEKDPIAPKLIDQKKSEINKLEKNSAPNLEISVQFGYIKFESLLLT